MKVVLCLSGQPRYIKECYDSLYSTIIKPYNPDVYAHMWWDDSYVGEKFKFHALDTYEENMQEVFMQYFQKSITKFEKKIDFDISKYDLQNGEMSKMLGPHHRELWSKEVIFKQLSMWYSVRESFDLINEDYDVYIRARTDLLYKKPIDLSITDSIQIDDFENKEQLCDWFAIGAKEEFKKYCSVYNFIDQISQNKVVISTRILREALSLQDCNVTVKDYGVNIFREYKKPFHMDNYKDNDGNAPYWL